ncbi:MAG: hypothetical protein HS115_02010 [Spirochaetales bacterium]|nr:hypothetical protein [Spirochaetales bacterium]
MQLRIVVLWFFPALVFADVVVLRNGQSLEGRIQRQDRSSIVLETTNGPRTIGRHEVRRITFGAVDLEAAQRREELLRQKKAAEEESRAEEERLLLEERKKEEARQREESSNRNRGLLLRSMVLPGWGHLAAGQTTPGALYAGTAAIMASATASLHTSAIASRSVYHTTALRNNLLALQLGSGNTLSAVKESSLLYSLALNRTARQDYTRSVANYNAFLAVDLTFYLAQLAHLAISTRSESMKTAGRVHFLLLPDTPETRQARHGIAWSFAWTNQL